MWPEFSTFKVLPGRPGSMSMKGEMHRVSIGAPPGGSSGRRWFPDKSLLKDVQV